MTLAALLALALGDPERATFMVDGLEREALVAVPAKRVEKAPLVFAWHGHGGSMAQAARSFRIHELWAEAVVVYPQGLPTPGRLSDPEGKKPGWQHAAGEQGDRDLKFFDVLLAAMKEKHGVERVFSMGHSNGGQFTYLLWAERGGAFDGLAPSGAVAGRGQREAVPCPILHVAGEKDPLVRFEWQVRGLGLVRRLNGCEETPKPWGPPGCEIYASAKGNPLVTFIHPGGHEYPKEAPELVVKFFKSVTRNQ